MKCHLCGKEAQSHPGIATDWRAIQINDRPPAYFCPDHFPPDPATEEQYCDAYTRCLRSLGIGQSNLN